MFPVSRMRRLRENSTLRRMVEETELEIEDFIYPIFVDENITEKMEIPSMPGISRIPLNDIENEGYPHAKMRMLHQLMMKMVLYRKRLKN